MPYLNKHRRDSLATWARPQTAGELNYAITKAIIDFLDQRMKAGHKVNYQLCNDVVGALENAKDEFQRRIQHPYEDRKIAENGDVYETLITNLNWHLQRQPPTTD